MNDLSNCFFRADLRNGLSAVREAVYVCREAARTGQGRDRARTRARRPLYAGSAGRAARRSARCARSGERMPRHGRRTHGRRGQPARSGRCGLRSFQKNRPRTGERNQTKVTADFQPLAPRRAPKNRRRRTLSAGTARAERPCRRSPARRTSRRQAASRSPRRARRKSARIPRK